MEGKKEIPSSERTKYSDIEIGTEFKSVEWSINEYQIDCFCEGNDDYHLWYSIESPWGDRVAPPLMNYRPARDRFSNTYKVRGLLYQYESEYFYPVQPNKKMTVSGHITNKWVKRGKAFVEYEVTCVDEDGKKIFWTRRVHLLDSTD